MAKTINLTGTSGKKYDLDQISKTNTRTSTDELVVQVWKWNPNLDSKNPHSKPNPPSPVVGQIWLSKLVAVGSPEYKEIASITNVE